MMRDHFGIQEDELTELLCNLDKRFVAFPTNAGKLVLRFFAHDSDIGATNLHVYSDWKHYLWREKQGRAISTCQNQLKGFYKNEINQGLSAQLLVVISGRCKTAL